MNTSMRVPTTKGLGEQFSGAFLFMGISLVVFGMVSIILAILSNFISVMLFGGILLAAGIAELVHVFRAIRRENVLLNVFSSLLYLVTGGVILFNPLLGALSLTLVLAAYLFVAGVIRCVYAIQHHKESGWGWFLFGGIVDLALASLIALGWPITALWVIGLLVGVEMLTYGCAMIALSAAIRKTERLAATDRLAYR